MADASAWLLLLSSGQHVAVGERQMVHLVQSPRLFEVLDAPPYCRQVLLWQEELVPLFDLAAWLHGKPAQSAPDTVGIFAYETANLITYGALPLAVVPARRPVSDRQACRLPDQPVGAWQRIAFSCFRDGEKKVPILDLQRLFSDTLL